MLTVLNISDTSKRDEQQNAESAGKRSELHITCSERQVIRVWGGVSSQWTSCHQFHWCSGTLRCSGRVWITCLQSPPVMSRAHATTMCERWQEHGTGNIVSGRNTVFFPPRLCPWCWFPWKLKSFGGGGGGGVEEVFGCQSKQDLMLIFQSNVAPKKKVQIDNPFHRVP